MRPPGAPGEEGAAALAAAAARRVVAALEATTPAALALTPEEEAEAVDSKPHPVVVPVAKEVLEAEVVDNGPGGGATVAPTAVPPAGTGSPASCEPRDPGAVKVGSLQYWSHWSLQQLAAAAEKETKAARAVEEEGGGTRRPRRPAAEVEYDAVVVAATGPAPVRRKRHKGEASAPGEEEAAARVRAALEASTAAALALTAEELAEAQAEAGSDSDATIDATIAPTAVPPSSKAKGAKPAAKKVAKKRRRKEGKAGGAALGQCGEPTAPTARAAERVPPALDEAIFSERAWNFQAAAEAARAKAASVPDEEAAALGAAAALRVTAALAASTAAALAEELAQAVPAGADAGTPKDAEEEPGPAQVPELVAAEAVDQDQDPAVLDYLRQQLVGNGEEEQPALDPADPAGGAAAPGPAPRGLPLVPAAGPSFEDVPGEPDAAPPAAGNAPQEDSIPSWFREKMAALANSGSDSD